MHAWSPLENSYWGGNKAGSSRKGIVFNAKKFQFCQDEAVFVGFTIGKGILKPSPKILESIKSNPVPKNISDIRGWFGQVNQVAPFLTEALRSIDSFFRA